MREPLLIHGHEVVLEHVAHARQLLFVNLDLLVKFEEAGLLDVALAHQQLFVLLDKLGLQLLNLLL